MKWKAFCPNSDDSRKF